MKVKRTQEEWRALFAEQRTCQLSVTQFCEQHRIPVTTFYNRRAQLEKHSSSTFCKATVIKTELTQSPIAAANGFQFETSLGKLVLPADISPDFLARFIKGLSS